MPEQRNRSRTRVFCPRRWPSGARSCTVFGGASSVQNRISRRVRKCSTQVPARLCGTLGKWHTRSKTRTKRGFRGGLDVASGVHIMLLRRGNGAISRHVGFTRALQLTSLAMLLVGASCGGTSDAASSVTSAGGTSGTGLGADAGGAQSITPSGACRADSDCAVSSGWSCFGPNTFYACGPVNNTSKPCSETAECALRQLCRNDPSTADAGLVCTIDRSCVNDSDCGNGLVCRADSTVPSGWVGSNGLACAEPCTSDAQCPPLDKCETNGHCRARTCAECPSYFSCTNGTCAIPSCTHDAECSGGYCVKTRCEGSLGTCRMLCL